MIFVYPVLVSENVDMEAVPSILKNMEIFFAKNIEQAIRDGSLKYVIEIDKYKRPEKVYFESNIILTEDAMADEEKIKKEIGELLSRRKNLSDKLYEDEKNLAIAKFQMSKLVMPGKEKAEKQKEIDDLQAKVTTYKNNLNAIDQEYDFNKEKLKNASKRRSEETKQKKEAEKEEEEEKGKAAKHGGAVKFDTIEGVSLYPYFTEIDDILVKFKSKEKGTYSDPAKIRFGVKANPVLVKNFSSIYSILQDDYYKNIFSRWMQIGFRYTVRKSIQWLTPNWSKRLLRMIVTKISQPWGIVWFDIIFSDRGYLNASGFQKTFPSKIHKQASSAVLMSSVDLQDDNFFSDPLKLRRLYRLGWNTFAIMDDENKKFLFCSHLEGGYCSMITYSHAFQIAKTDRIQPDKDMGRFLAPRRISMRGIGKILNKRKLASEQVEKHYDKFK